ncbi:conjugative transposon protein TraM [Pedobacter jamesrossensis]|uniref:Conjugative transposon protein TraM n=1 Tax=Pedobacter jamesrossensis TaxID=1908238 RepID=A0ABV8NN90_9SPHI
MKTQEERTRKMLLVLPLLVLPFLSLGFYALGGGKGNSTAQLTSKPGINTSLPDAAFKKEDPQTKLSLYELAGREQKPDSLPASVTGQGFGLASAPDLNEQRISEKLSQISTEINRPLPPVDYATRYSQPANNSNMTVDVDRLEKLMRTMQEDKAEDPEMKQLSEMMDKIIAIQNPESVAIKTVKTTGSEGDTKFKAIPAQIVDKQKAVQGATIKLRLQDTITLYGYLIPKGHEIFGTCGIINQRLLLDIKNIRLGTSIIPVDLSVYSLDGMPGLYAPEAELANAAGSGADDAVRSIGMYGMDNSIATQVAGAGIDAAKSLFSKKIKKIKVKLESGQPVLLRNNQQKLR